MPPLERRPPGARLPLGLAVAALCMLCVGGAAGERRQQPVEGEDATTQQKLQRTTVLLSEAQRQRIDRAFSRASWQSLHQTPAAATRRRSSSSATTAKVKKVVAKLQNLLGQAAQVHAYGNVYRPYGDQWRGQKSVLYPEVDRNGKQLTGESGNKEDALSGQAMVCLRSASLDLCIRFLAHSHRCMQVHAPARTRARAHARTHAHTLLPSLSRSPSPLVCIHANDKVCALLLTKCWWQTEASAEAMAPSGAGGSMRAGKEHDMHADTHQICTDARR